MRNNRLFFLGVIFILLLGFVLHLYAISGNRIFFTVDEGRDSVYARQIVYHHQIFTKGPQATLKGLYTGPLWYYFVALGFLLTGGHPAGTILLLVLLNLGAIFVLMMTIKKEVGVGAALITGLGLTISWQFFTTSLWGFNPFVLPALAIFLILLLIKNKYGAAVVPIILAFNAELAGAISLFLFYIFLGGIWVLRKKLNTKKYLFFAFFLPFLGVAKILFDFIRTPREVVISTGVRLGTTNFMQMTKEFIKIIGGAAIPQNTTLGFLLIIIVALYYLLKMKNKNSFIKSFCFLTTLLISVSFLFFGGNHGWSAWHTVYILPLVFTSLFLISFELKLIGKGIIVFILLMQLINFKSSYLDYLKPSPNPSLLSNQIKVIDWIYTHAEGNGFNLYTYTNTYVDYTYQYLTGWYGRTKYGFYPCEYANFPLSIKSLYIPHPENYVEPKLGCDKFRFLIIDAETNGNENKNWIIDYRKETILLEKTQIGDTTIEKRKVPDRIR